jgi:hypothetical protein
MSLNNDEKSLYDKSLDAYYSYCEKCVRENKQNKYILYNPKILSLFRGMKRRCYSIKETSYKNYGGRGIKICAEWLNDKRKFYEWASDKWQAGLTIDRIDNDGDYTPENCRFVTKEEQNNNTRRNRYIDAFNERKTIAMWAKDKRCVVCFDVCIFPRFGH